MRFVAFVREVSVDSIQKKMLLQCIALSPLCMEVGKRELLLEITFGFGIHLENSIQW